MEYFTHRFQGAWVCVWYEACNDDEAVWIANIVMGDDVMSLDGLVALGSGLDIADIARSVDRALQWAINVNGALARANTMRCRSAMATDINVEVELPMPGGAVAVA